MAESEKQKKNRTPPTAWKPGQSGNPRGRPPKGLAMTEIIRELAEIRDYEMELRVKSGAKKLPRLRKVLIDRKRALANRVWDIALNGSENGVEWPAVRFLWEKLDGDGNGGPGLAPVEGTAQEIWIGMMAMMRRVSDQHPEIRKSLLDEVNRLKPAG